MKVDPLTGLVEGARYLPSPNCDARPADTVVDLVVVHGISMPPGEFGGPWIDALFTNTLPPERHPYFAEVAALKVSAHVLVRRDGELVQYVPCHQRAWHAGPSRWQGRKRCNDFSIGIELEGVDDLPYTPVQYERLAALLFALMDAYPALTPQRIVGHSDVAPGRKTDPGPAFEWRRLHALLEAGPPAVEQA